MNNVSYVDLVLNVQQLWVTIETKCFRHDNGDNLVCIVTWGGHVFTAEARVNVTCKIVTLSLLLTSPIPDMGQRPDIDQY